LFSYFQFLTNNKFDFFFVKSSTNPILRFFQDCDKHIKKNQNKLSTSNLKKHKLRDEIERGKMNDRRKKNNKKTKHYVKPQCLPYKP